MRQGKADREGRAGWKRDPMANAMNVKGASQIGQAIGNHVTGRGRVLTDVIQPLHAGRGFNSPLGAPGTPGVGAGGRTVHRSGSQGRR